MTAADARIRIMVADDHPIFREGIRAILSLQEDMELVAEAEDGNQAVELFEQFKPDVVLMDIQMPGRCGISAMRSLLATGTTAKFIVLTTYQGDVQITNALKAGAASYLVKSTLRSDLAHAIRQVHSGEHHIPQEIAQLIQAHATDEVLTAREVQVLGQVAAGLSNKRIAKHMGISGETVKTHMKSVLGKIKAKDRTEAVVTALRRGILEE